ncbi:hypothetical protein Tco_0748396 [Tanacetum coccineum]|uniref:Uncharacterized protein n=1 Tax=Tanacetum coccineum TaxID=301880 RepID=A0ABQ4YVR9_9ASTR
MTNASSTACMLGCTGVTNCAWLLEVIFEVGFRGVIGCEPPLISLPSSPIGTLADVMSVGDEGVVSISITIVSKELEVSDIGGFGVLQSERLAWVFVVKMDDPNITMEEYIRLKEEKARRHGKVYNWETTTYGKIWDNKDVHDLGSVETDVDPNP